jgi:TRAP-type C4-dicarboxylate transport system permease small subunit
VPFGAGLIGTGLILLGVNAVRALKGTSIESDNTLFGILALVWGGLELARPILRRLSESTDWDWGIFAILLIVLGGIVLARKLPHMRDKNVKELR